MIRGALLINRVSSPISQIKSDSLRHVFSSSGLSSVQSTRRLTKVTGSRRQANIQRKFPIIQTALQSVDSTVARLLPSTVEEKRIAMGKEFATEIIGQVISGTRKAVDAETIEDARKGWSEVETVVRQDLRSRAIPASALTELSNLVIRSSSDPRRHSIAFNLYRIAFGIDPAALPERQAPKDSARSQYQPASAELDWGDWQAAYHWASLVMQGKAPPPAGSMLMSVADRRSAQQSQFKAAYNVFAHLAAQGHPRGVFGMAQHILSSLERSVDPTAFGVVASIPGQSGKKRHDIVAEAERLFREAGDSGVEEAWFQLGALYVEGKWVRKDESKAQSFLEEAVFRGSPQACHALAHILTRGARSAPKSNFPSEGRPDSMSEVAERHHRLLRSLQLLEQGADLGSADCAFSAGMRYLLQPPVEGNQSAASGLDGLDTSLNAAKAIILDPAQRMDQAKGEHRAKWGVEADDIMAGRWLTVAAERGNTLAMMNLARMYLEGRIVAPAPIAEDARSANRSVSPRMAQLLQSSSWYSKLVAKAMGPEGQRAKAVSELQERLSEVKGQSVRSKSSPCAAEQSLSAARLDDLGKRAEEGLRVVREEIERLLATSP